MLLAATLYFAAPAMVSAQAKITQLHVYPPNIQLTTQRDTQRYVVVATRDDGVTLDVTDAATVTLDNPALASLEGHVVSPKADGTANLQVEYEGLTASTTVDVQQATADRPISFQLDVMPVFMRAGCNTGSCHGAARGKDGFRLSLFGFDPKATTTASPAKIGVRRINLAIPEHSLLIEKAIGAVPHTGGKRFDADSEYNETLLRWLRGRRAGRCGEPPARRRVWSSFPPGP